LGKIELKIILNTDIIRVKSQIVHPFLFAVFPILALYAHNIDQTSFESLLWPLMIVLLFAAGLFMLLRYCLSDAGKSGLIVSLIMVLFFTYGHIHAQILEWISKYFFYKADFKVINYAARADIAIHILLLILFIVILKKLITIVRKKTFSIRVTHYLNTVSLFLIVINLSYIIFYTAKAEKYEYRHDSRVKTSYIRETSQKPDIYYIILDGYARGDILKEFYGFDNSEFLDYLRRKGFFIADKSYSNYAWTFLSLPSSLNLKYINYLSDTAGKLSNDLRIPYEMIKNNYAANFLKKRGYLFVHFNSTWGATLRNRYADVQVSYKKGLFNDEFIRVLTKTTILKVIDSFIIENLAEVHLNAFRKLEEIPEIKEPTFTFVHMILPHHPYIFDRHGNIKSPPTMLNQFTLGKWEMKDEYIDQLIFVNKKTEEVIGKIIERSEIPPIIIIQSDHGPQILTANTGVKEYVRARMSILNAYYLPEGGNKMLYHSISPVNTFRVVFNYYFQSEFELLEDNAYFSKMEQPYNFLKMNL